MNLFNWLRQLAGKQSPLPAGSEQHTTTLRLMQLEKRRLLNGDFSFLGGAELALDNVDADLVIQETGSDFHFILNSGQWNGTDAPGSIIGNGTGFLTIDKAAFNGLANGTTIQADAASTLSFNSTLASLDLSGMVGELTVDGFATVDQINGDVRFNDITIQNAQQVALQSVTADDISIETDELNFLGGLNSVGGTTFSLMTNSVSTMVLGGNGDIANQLDFQDADINALANGFSSLSFGDATVATNIFVDASGASFGDGLTLDSGGGLLEVRGQLDTVSDLDSGAIVLNGSGSGVVQSGNIITNTGLITINDGLLIDGTVRIDSSNFAQASAADVTVAGVIDGLNNAGNDRLTVSAIFGAVDGVQDGRVDLMSSVEGQSGTQSLTGGMDLEGLFVQAGTVNVHDIHAGRIDLLTTDIDLQGNDYTSGSTVLLDGRINLVSSGSLQITGGGAATDHIVVTGAIVDAGSSSDLVITAGLADVDLQGDVASLANPLGSLSVDATNVQLQNVFTNGVLAVDASSTVLRGTQYISQQSGVSFTGDVDLSVGGAANVVLQSGGDQAVNVGGIVIGTNDSLRVESQGDVALSSVALGDADLEVRVDSDNDGANAATFDSITARSVTLAGSAACDDTIQLNGSIAAVQTIDISQFVSLAVNNSITSDGTVSIAVCDALTFGAGGNITSAGNTALTADSDGDGSGGVAMNAASFVDAAASSITISATQDVVVTGLTTSNATSAAVFIESTAGAIVDGGDLTADIIANQPGAVTTLRAATGIGDTDGLEVQLAEVDGVNTTSGRIALFEADDLDVRQLRQVNDGSIQVVTAGDLHVTANGDGIRIQETSDTGGDGEILLQADAGTITVDQAIVNNDSGGGSTTLRASGNDHDVLLDASIETASGSIEILADDSIQLTANSDLTSAATGNIRLDANHGAVSGDSLGTILMADGSLIDAGTGEISLRTASAASTGDVVVGGLLTANSTLNAVLIHSSGAVIDGGDVHKDIDADQSGARTTILAATGIGSGNSLEFCVDQLVLNNSQAGDIVIDEAGDFIVSEIIQRENFDVHITVGGTLTVVEGGGGITIMDDLASDGTGSIHLTTIDGDIVIDDELLILGGGPGAGIVIDANGVDRDIIVNSTLSTHLGSVAGFADDSVFLTADGMLTAGGDGDIQFAANATDVAGDSNNQIQLADGSVLESETGTIHLQATGTNGGDITVAHLSTSNNTVDAILIETSQAVIDAGDSDLDIDANQTGARTTILASTGIGALQPLETRIHEIVAVNDDGIVAASGSIELNESDDLRVILLDNNATVMDGSAPTGQAGAITVAAGGDLHVVDDGDDTHAAIQSEKSIHLTAEDILVDDDIIAIDDTPGTGGDADESIVIDARGNFDLLDNRTISTDDAPGIRSVTPNVFTNDVVRITADSDGNAIDADGDLIPDEGIVFVAETATIRTDGGVANLFARRPELEESPTAFYDSTSIMVSEIEFIEISTDEGNIYEGLVTVFVGNAGEENLVLTVDWGDGFFSSDPTAFQRLSVNAQTDLRNELDPDELGRFDAAVDGDKVQFLIPEGGREYVIPHRYSDFDVSLDIANQPARSEASDPFPVRFSVSHHAPSIEVVGTSIVDPADPQAGPIVVPGSDDVAPLARLSSSNVFDDPTNPQTRFDNGVTEFTISTRSVPRALLQKEVIEIPEVQEVAAADDAVAVSETVQTEALTTTTSSSSVTSEDFFQLRRRYADGTSEVIIKRISEVEGDQLFDRERFEEFVRAENLNDGSGYEIWLITSDPKGNVPVERPVFEFDVTAGKPGPASEELPDEFEELRLVPVEEFEDEQQQQKQQPTEDDDSEVGKASAKQDAEAQQVGPLLTDVSQGIKNSEIASIASLGLLVATPEAVRFSRRARAVRRMRETQDQINAVEDAAN